MKNIKPQLFISIATLFAMVSCEKVATSDNNTVQEDDTLITFNAQIAKTRVTVAGDGKCSWEKDDEIKIFWLDGSGNAHSTTAVAKEAGSSTSFSAAVDAADYYYAVYPSSATATLSAGGSLTVTIPSSQDGTLAHADICAAKTSAADLSFTFQHIVSLLKFENNRADIVRADVVAKENVCLSGSVECTFGASLSVGSADTRGVSATLNGAGTYYIAIAGGVEASAIAVKLSTSDPAVVIPAVNIEPTGGLSFTRAHILNVGRIDDRIITDYYIATDGSGNGLLESTPAPFSLLTTLAGNDVYRNRVIAGTTVHLAGGTYTPAVVLSLNPEESAPFTIKGEDGGTSIISGGGSTQILKTQGIADVHLEKLTLKSGSASQGGALYMNGGKVEANDCTFSSNTASGNAAVLYATGTSDVSFTDCSFVSNSCTGSSNAPSVAMLWGNAFLKVNGCYFGSNTAANRAVINSQGTSVVFISNSAFNNNSNTAASTYASVIHAAGAGAAIHNSTFNQNNAKDGSAPRNNCECITAATNLILTNNTFYEYFQSNRGVIAGTAAKEGILFNNVVLNNYSGTVFYFSSAGFKFTSYGHNIYRNITDYRTGDAKIGIPAASGDIAGVDKTILSGGAWNGTNHVYAWNGTLTSGTLTKATATELEPAIKAMTQTVGNTVVGAGTQLGTAFWNWINSIGATTTDQLGTDRGSSWWPGAYQN